MSLITIRKNNREVIQKLRKLLHLESYEESLRDFTLTLEESEFLKSEIDLMAREYSSSSKELDQWLSTEKELEVQELVKSQQSGLTSRYLSFLSSKKKEYDKLEESKKLFIKKYPHFEKALQDLKRNDFIEKTLDSYRENRLSLDECTTIIKAVTKEKVKYSDNIVFNQKGDILIEQRGPLDINGPNLWCLPGGHINLGEDHKTAAIRELQEETGYEVKDCQPIGIFEDEDCHIEYFSSIVDTNKQSPTVHVEETRYTEFVPLERLYDYPTIYNIWDNVYKILGIDENIVKVKKAISGGIKNEKVEKSINNTITERLVESGFMKAQKMQPPDFEKEEKLEGGSADEKTLEDIARKHKLTLEEITREWSLGVKEEKEHTTDAEERSEITKDHLWKDPKYYSKLKTIEKSDMTEFEKAKQLGHLVPKKVQVKDKSGKVHMAIRWINPQTGESEKYSEGLKENKKVEGGTFEEQVEVIASSNLPKSDKVRNLIDLGIYDSGLLTLLTGEPTPGYFLKQSDIDLKELPDQSETILKEVRKEQLDNDTPQEREDNKLLIRNPEDVEELWDNYKRNIKRVIQGRHKFAIAYGTGGVGKTFEFEQLAKKFELREYDDEIQPSKDQYDYVVISGRISPIQVYAEMYRHRDKLIVFDDCDSFLKEDEVQGFLKKGLDTGENTKISNKSSKKIYQVEGDPESGTIPNSFSFKGRVIAITNLTSRQIDQPIKSRALSSNLTMTIDETILKLSTIKDKIKILTADKSSIVEVSQEARDYAFELIKEQKSKLGGDINTRTYSNAILIANDAMEEGIVKEKIRREIIGYFDSVTGSFDEMIRKQKGK